MTRRLLFWCEEFFSIGGCQVALGRQVRELLRRGYGVTVASRDRAGPLAPPPGVAHLPLPLGEDPPEVGRHDLVYVQRVFKSDPGRHLRALWRLSGRVPTLLRVPTLGDLAALRGLRPARWLGRIAGFIALSDALEAELRALLPAPVIHRQHNGLPPGALGVRRFSTSGPFVFIGRLSSTKGVDLLLDAWASYRAGGGRRELLVLGPPKAGHPVRRLQDPSFMRRHAVRYAGAAARVWEQVPGAFALLKPSRSEGHCNVMLEAMAAGVPLIAADIPGLREDIAAAGAGVLLPSGDAPALAAALARAECRPEDMARMAGRGPGFIQRHRTLEQTVVGLTRAVEQALMP